MEVFTVEEFTGKAINRAVSKCKERGGGNIFLPRGIYEIESPVFLESGMTLFGEQGKTVLKKTKGETAQLILDADFNQRHITVNREEIFKKGMGIQIYRSQEEDCWGVTTTIVVSAKGREIRCADYMKRDYEAGCKVSNSFPMICVKNAEEVCIRDLVVDGTGEENDFINGCRGGGIYFYKSKDCRVQNVCVCHYNGDGISWQTTQRISIINTEVKGCSNFGLHPGAGSQGTLVENCSLHHNGKVGLYLCWRVKNSIFRNNHIYENKFAGISLGHRDSDNQICGNRIENNGEYAIYMRPEKIENQPVRNTIWNNCIK